MRLNAREADDRWDFDFSPKWNRPFLLASRLYSFQITIVIKIRRERELATIATPRKSSATMSSQLVPIAKNILLPVHITEKRREKVQRKVKRKNRRNARPKPKVSRTKEFPFILIHLYELLNRLSSLPLFWLHQWKSIGNGLICITIEWIPGCR